MTLTFNLGGHRDCRSYASCYFGRELSANFGDATTIRFRFVTLRPWPLTLEVMAPVADAGRRPLSVYSTEFEVRRRCRLEDTAHAHDVW